ncbi:MAG: hypothetical protein OSB07_08730 [Dehalococcoidia bacterium]|nr:hypothetical protein [Dehalococcoidia bacterium]
MKDLWPKYADRVNFYAIGQSPFESLERRESYAQKEGYPWPVAEIDPKILKDLKVLQQSTKIALDHQGVITYRDGYADGGVAKWRQVFEELIERTGS